MFGGVEFTIYIFLGGGVEHNSKHSLEYKLVQNKVLQQQEVTG